MQESLGLSYWNSSREDDCLVVDRCGRRGGRGRDREKNTLQACGHQVKPERCRYRAGFRQKSFSCGSHNAVANPAGRGLAPRRGRKSENVSNPVPLRQQTKTGSRVSSLGGNGKRKKRKHSRINVHLTSFGEERESQQYRGGFWDQQERSLRSFQ